MEVFVLGDSISIHYGPYLKKYLDKKFSYDRKRGMDLALEDLDTPKGANGGDSFLVLEYLESELNNGKIFDILLLNCGAHDIRRFRDNHRLQVTPEEYEKNLLKILSLLKNSCKKLIFINTCPIIDELHNSRLEGFLRYNEDVLILNSIAQKLMDNNEIQIVDLYSFTKNLGHDIYCDHVHFDETTREKQGEFLATIINNL